jgi:hypothetical protein
MSKHKSEDYKISAVQYYLTKNKNQLQTLRYLNVIQEV